MTQTDINSAIAERALAGESLTEAELAELDTVDVLALGMLADEVRRSGVGAAVGYTRVLEMGQSVAAPDAGFLARLARAGEARIASPAGSIDETTALVASARAAVGPSIRLAGFSLAALVERGWATSEVAAGWKTAGLDAIAEAPIDLVEPAHVAAMLAGGLAVDTLSLQRPYEPDRVAQLVRTRGFVATAPGASVSPLPRVQSVAAPTTGYHDVRLVALVRLALPRETGVQVDWQQYGPKLAQVALTFGANRLDRVGLDDDLELGRRRASVEDVRRNIAAAGFEPVERRAGR
jgi:aminodeoxyfutalosine synthase